MVATGARLRCAACDHRWVPQAPASPGQAITTDPEADEEAAFAAVQEQMRSPHVPAVESLEPSPFEIPGEPDETKADKWHPETSNRPLRPIVLRNVVAVISGLALTVAAAGLWIGPVDFAKLPLVQPLVPHAALPPLQIMLTATTTILPSGGRLLEVSGTLSNPGLSSVAIPRLDARLTGPQGVALRWTIALPVARLGPRTQIGFTSTVTGFPASARTLAVTPHS